MSEVLAQLEKKGGSNAVSFLEPLQACAWGGSQTKYVIGNLTVGSATTLTISDRAIACVANVTGFKGTFKYTFTGSWQNYCFGLKEGVITPIGATGNNINVTDYDYVMVMIASTSSASNVVITLTQA